MIVYRSSLIRRRRPPSPPTGHRTDLSGIAERHSGANTLTCCSFSEADSRANLRSSEAVRRPRGTGTKPDPERKGDTTARTWLTGGEGESRHRVLRRLKLRTQSRQSGGHPEEEVPPRRHRAHPLRWGRVRGLGGRTARLLQEGYRPAPHPRGDPGGDRLTGNGARSPCRRRSRSRPLP